jgi:hypothetical protein
MMTVLGRRMCVRDVSRAGTATESAVRTRRKNALLRATIARKAVFHKNIFVAKKRDSEFARSIFCPSLRSVFVFNHRCIALVAMKESAGAQAFL